MNLVDEAENLLLHQWEKSPKIIGLIRTLVQPLQEAYEHLQRLYDGRYIDEATGDRLDIIGRIVGQPRYELDDDAYRLWLKVRIRLNLSHGRAEDVLGILRILLGKVSVLIDEYYPNDVMLCFSKEPTVPVKAMIRIIKAAMPVSTQSHFKAAYLQPLFIFDVAETFEGHFAEFYGG